MVDYYPRRSRLVVQVDVFQAHGFVPTNLDQVNEREKDIRYSSRTRIVTEALRERHNVRHTINELHKLLPPEIAATPEAKQLYDHGCVTEVDIAQLIYRPNEPQGAATDFEFSRATMLARWEAGLNDARETLAASPWLAPMARDVGVRVFDVVHEKLVRHGKTAPPEWHGGSPKSVPGAQPGDGPGTSRQVVVCDRYRIIARGGAAAIPGAWPDAHAHAGIAQERDQQFAHHLGLFRQHPMPGAVDQMEADQPGAGLGPHALLGARRLVGAPVGSCPR